MVYPKIYATYLGRFRIKSDGEFVGFVNIGSVHRFETDDGQIIEAPADHRSGGRLIGSSGHTPRRLKRKWFDTVREQGYRKAVSYGNLMPPGTKVKLYQREGRWMYRHLGQ